MIFSTATKMLRWNFLLAFSDAWGRVWNFIFFKNITIFGSLLVTTDIVKIR